MLSICTFVLALGVAELICEALVNASGIRLILEHQHGPFEDHGSVDEYPREGADQHAGPADVHQGQGTQEVQHGLQG